MRYNIALIAVVAAFATITRAAEPIVFPVVEDGRPVCQVVVAGDNEVLAAAVEDLVAYVRKATGADLEVHRGRADRPGPTLHLGETEHFPATEAARQAIELDGVLVQRVGEDLILAGTMPQGTANGVWTILQDQFGVRWYYAGELWEIVPGGDALAIRLTPNHGPEAYVENPSFPMRRLWGDPPSPAFGRRMRLTQQGVRIPFQGTSHHLNRIVNPEQHGDKPEYFAYFDGRRHVEYDVHPCFTHPDMFDIFMDYVRQGNASFGVNDNLTACRCDRCLEVDGDSEPYMGMWNFSESYFQLIRRVAEQTAKEFPERRLGVFAYQVTNSPPRTVDHVGENLDVTLCQDTSQYFDAQQKRIDEAMAVEWTRKAGGVAFYDYIGLSCWTPRYFPTLLAGQIRHLARLPIVSYGTHNGTMPESSMPMFYLYYQMLWNADLDGERLVAEMIRDLFGDVAEDLGRFYDHWERCWMRQEQGRWLFGIDNLPGEMEIYTLEDILEGKAILEQARQTTRDDDVRRRIEMMLDYFRFSVVTTRAWYTSRQAMEASPPERPEEAIAMSDAVREAWNAFEERYEMTRRLPGSTISGWHYLAIRVRMWGLKQQMRDGAAAPLVRWIVAQEGRLPPEELRAIERRFAEVAIRNRTAIEKRVIESVDAAYRRPRADALRVADIPRRDVRTVGDGATIDWDGVPFVDATEWVYRLRPAEAVPGRYEEPFEQHYVDPPAPDDQSMRWQATWDDEHLYIRLRVRDDMHVQNMPAPEMWKQDSVQIALNARRDLFAYDVGSWDYMWGGYRGNELEFGVSLRDGSTQLHVWQAPGTGAGRDPASRILARAARSGGETVYEVAVAWELVEGFDPSPERSVGICLVVNDVDDGERRSAEYGSGVPHAKRPAEFAAVRLVE